MDSITHDQLATVLDGFWFAQQVGSERTADDIFESAEALFGGDDGSAPEWSEVRPSAQDPHVYFCVIDEGRLASGVRFGPFGTFEAALDSEKPIWFMTYAAGRHWHVSAVRTAA